MEKRTEPEEPGAFEGGARWFYDEPEVEWTAPEEPTEEEIEEMGQL